MNPEACSYSTADALWLLTARSRGGAHWVANADCQIHTMQVGRSNQPLSLLDHSQPNTSYVASPRSAWLRYPEDEAARHLLPGWAGLARWAAACMLSPLALLMQQAGLDQAVILGNKLISTNLHPDWGRADIDDAQQQLIQTYPQRPLMLRNVCPQLTPNLASALHDLGWQLVPARMVYLCDPADQAVWKHNHIKQDLKLLTDGQVEVLHPEQIRRADLPGLRQVFRQLFIHKHSTLNPDFTPEFFELCLESGFLQLFGLRRAGHIVGVLGLYEQQDTHTGQRWLTTPLIGYDLEQPRELGLYRRLMALLLQQAQQRGARLHYSSGAGQFKRSRGGTVHMEYSAIFSRHLSTATHRMNVLFASTMGSLAPGLLARAEAWKPG